MIPIFSKNKANSGLGIEDGLSLYASSLERDFTFRTKIFGPSPNITFSNTFKLEVGKWYSFSALIDQYEVEYSIDEKLYAKAQLKDNEIQNYGYFGFYRNETSDFTMKNL